MLDVYLFRHGETYCNNDGRHTGWLAAAASLAAGPDCNGPDLILLPGDFVAGHLPAHSATPEEIAARLGRLNAKLGVYAVLGNHDHWQQPQRIEAALAANGIGLLENRSVRLEADGKPFHLVGVTDWLKQRQPDWGALLPPDSLPSLVMTHTPDVFDSMPEKPALAVAGHTHGGQIDLPLLGAPAVPSRFGERYLRGLIRDRGNLVFVTTGLVNTDEAGKRQAVLDFMNSLPGVTSVEGSDFTDAWYDTKKA